VCGASSGERALLQAAVEVGGGTHERRLGARATVTNVGAAHLLATGLPVQAPHLREEQLDLLAVALQLGHVEVGDDIALLAQHGEKLGAQHLVRARTATQQRRAQVWGEADRRGAGLRRAPFALQAGFERLLERLVLDVRPIFEGVGL
jgi:hypothetical protein